jgi:hypothetical protein
MLQPIASAITYTGIFAVSKECRGGNPRDPVTHHPATAKAAANVGAAEVGASPLKVSGFDVPNVPVLL